MSRVSQSALRAGAVPPALERARHLLATARRLTTNPPVTTLGDVSWSRAAVLLGRQALEAAIAAWLATRRDGVWLIAERGRFTSQLLALQLLIPPEEARELAQLWSQLSEETHHSGYDLPPPPEAVNDWLNRIERLCQE